LPRLFGRHQLENAGTAIAAARRLEGFDISAEAIAKGLTTAVWPARLERLSHGKLHDLAPAGSEIWLDGGHNPAAGEVVARALADLEERVPSPIHLIVGMLSTKDAGGFLRHFHGLTELAATIEIPGHANAYRAEDLAYIAHREGISALAAGSLEAAFAKSRNLARGPVRISAGFPRNRRRATSGSAVRSGSTYPSAGRPSSAPPHKTGRRAQRPANARRSGGLRRGRSKGLCASNRPQSRNRICPPPWSSSGSPSARIERRPSRSCRSRPRCRAQPSARNGYPPTSLGRGRRCKSGSPSW